MIVFSALMLTWEWTRTKWRGITTGLVMGSQLVPLVIMAGVNLFPANLAPYVCPERSSDYAVYGTAGF